VSRLETLPRGVGIQYVDCYHLLLAHDSIIHTHQAKAMPLCLVVNIHKSFPLGDATQSMDSNDDVVLE
jgi:hypothetical protein